MIAEHDFVTTLDGVDAMATAATLARWLGYRVDHADAQGLSAAAGLAKPNKAKRYDELPQRLEITFDRGRVNLAASILPKRKEDALHGAMMVTTLNLLEAVIARGVPIDQATEDWRAIQHRVVDQRMKEKRRNVIVVSVLVIIASLLVTGMVLAIANL